MVRQANQLKCREQSAVIFLNHLYLCNMILSGLFCCCTQTSDGASHNPKLISTSALSNISSRNKLFMVLPWNRLHCCSGKQFKHYFNSIHDLFGIDNGLMTNVILHVAYIYLYTIILIHCLMSWIIVLTLFEGDHAFISMGITAFIAQVKWRFMVSEWTLSQQSNRDRASFTICHVHLPISDDIVPFVIYFQRSRFNI